MTPRFSEAVLVALARVQATRRRLLRAQFENTAFSAAWAQHDEALKALWSALDAEPVRAHPVPVGDEDEASRMPSPHRFQDSDRVSYSTDPRDTEAL